MEKCGCYFEDYDRPECWGTKERDVCSCGGDKTKCNFYPKIKEEALRELKGIVTNADRIRNMTDEELAEWLTGITNDAQIGSEFHVDYEWNEWLKEEVKE